MKAVAMFSEQEMRLYDMVQQIHGADTHGGDAIGILRRYLEEVWDDGFEAGSAEDLPWSGRTDYGEPENPWRP